MENNVKNTYNIFLGGINRKTIIKDNVILSGEQVKINGCRFDENFANFYKKYIPKNKISEPLFIIKTNDFVLRNNFIGGNICFWFF